ncbi:MAG: amino acid ABC transporter ATP-binding protein [Eubacteriales bacterium]|nr:amino acid ABC transporter ATP-binding protein [Eubacteriales bacterium]
MSVLSVKDIYKRFDDEEVIRGVSFDVQEGEVLSLIGRSGSGKSTILRLATQLETLDAGSIAYGDRYLVRNGKYADRKTLRMMGKNYGLVFQNFNLFPHFSVLRNITEAPVVNYGEKREVAEARAMELLERMELSDKARAYPYQLSGGQKQRVAIARALALDPKILFFDEPTSALDPMMTGEILKVIRDLAARRMTMVVVTHEMAFAREISDRVIFLSDGKIVAEGSPEEVFEESKNKLLCEFLKR